MNDFVSAFSARLACSPPEKIDSEIQNQMGKLLELLDASRLCWFVIGQSEELVRVYSVHKRGTAPPAAIIGPKDLPYALARLVRGQKIVLRRVGDLPPQAKRDRQFFREHSVKSVLLIPANHFTSDRGVLTLAFSSWRRLPRDLVKQLETVGNVIAAAVERRFAEEARRESELRFHHLFEQALTGIAIKNFAGQILFANPTLCSTLGYSEKELCGMDTSRFIDRENCPNELDLFEKLHTGQIDNYKVEKRFTRKDGVKVWGRLQVSLLKNSSQSPLIIAMLEDISEQKAAEDRLKRAQSELEQLTTRLIQVQDEERHRISRELHDDIGQRLALLAAGLADWRSPSSTERRGDERRRRELIEQITELSKDVHQLSHRLHSSQLELVGLCAALKNLAAHLSRQHGISITLKCDFANGSMPSEIELCLFRVTQEGLNNVIRHSNSQRAFVEVTNISGVIRLAITDEGVGFDQSHHSSGIGLISMRERLRIVGGTLAVRSQPGHGTQITAEVNAARPP